MLGFVLGSKPVFYMKFVGANVGIFEYLQGRQTTCQATQRMPGWQERQDISISLYN